MLIPDAAIAGDAKDFGFVHRQTEDVDVYFVANTSNIKKSVEISFRNTGMNAEIWDAMNGKINRRQRENVDERNDKRRARFRAVSIARRHFFQKQTSLPKKNTKLTEISAINLNADWNFTFGQTNQPI